MAGAGGSGRHADGPLAGFAAVGVAVFAVVYCGGGLLATTTVSVIVLGAFLGAGVGLIIASVALVVVVVGWVRRRRACAPTAGTRKAGR